MEFAQSALTGRFSSASILVAADGLWSGLRPHIGGRPANLAPVGKTAFRSVTPASNLPPELTPNAVHIWLAPGAHAVHYPVNGGRDIALVIIADDPSRFEGWDAPVIADAAREKVETFAAPLRTLVASAKLVATLVALPYAAARALDLRPRRTSRRCRTSNAAVPRPRRGHGA